MYNLSMIACLGMYVFALIFVFARVHRCVCTCVFACVCVCLCLGAGGLGMYTSSGRGWGQDLGVDISEAQVKELVRESDYDGDGQVSYLELCRHRSNSKLLQAQNFMQVGASRASVVCYLVGVVAG